MSIKKIVFCENCSKEILVFPSQIKKSKNNRFFCNRKCKHGWMRGKKLEEIVGEETAKKRKENFSKNFQSSGNPNFGKRWSEKQRAKASIMMIERMKDPEYKHLAGSANRGVKFSKERKRKQREGMVRNGYWVKIENKSDYKFYCMLSNWIVSMYNIVEEGQELYKQYGKYNFKKNFKGMVRDHRYSRKQGFDNKVFPEILRHPLNCELMSIKNNTKKLSRSSILLENLFESILNYDKEWFEKKKCEILIEEYRNGKKFDRKIYEKKVNIEGIK